MRHVTLLNNTPIVFLMFWLVTDQVSPMYYYRVFSCIETELTGEVGRLLELSGTSSKSVSAAEKMTTTCSENGECEFDQ